MIDNKSNKNNSNVNNKTNKQDGITIREYKGFTVIENHNPLKPKRSKGDPNEPVL